MGRVRIQYGLTANRPNTALLLGGPVYGSTWCVLGKRNPQGWFAGLSKAKGTAAMQQALLNSELDWVQYRGLWGMLEDVQWNNPLVRLADPEKIKH